ncbi:FAD-binding oxidoreductase [soil metagenome]
MTELPASADAVIIGAGIMGCSIAYHLAERGMTDVVVLEKDYIGRGSTADAAGGIRLQFSTRANIELMQISIDYWENFEERFGQFINFRQQGYLFLLTSEDNVAEFQTNLELQQSMGVPARWVTPDDIAELNPAVNLDGSRSTGSGQILGGTICPRDGWADTSTSTMGFAQAARRLGVKIIEETPVTGIVVQDGKIAGVDAGGSHIAAPQVICAAGPYTGLVGEMAGVELPVAPVRRMSWVTGPFEEIPPSAPFTIEFERSLYFHPESGGFLFGMSDPDEPPSWNKSVDQSWLVTTVDALAELAPAFANATVRNGWAGLYEVTPDHNPLVGAVEEVEGLSVAAGFSGHGFMQGPAIGLLMTELLVDGEFRTVDLSDFRPARFIEGELRREHNVI